MSFGFSVGDFLPVGKLAADITNSLREAGGSKSEYQELLQELESLNHALKHLDKLPTKDTSANLESIKYAALSCRRPLEQFLGKIEKYDKALGIWGGANPIKKTADKLRWAFGEKDEIKKLQNYLNIHVGTINILLAEHGLEMMNIASEKGELDQLHIRERLDNTKSLMQFIKDSVIAQTAAVQNNNSMLTKLFGMVSGELGSSLKSLGEMIAKIYGIVLEIRGSLASPDAKWIFFQAPLMVEDALGFKFPVPSEYDFKLLNAIIKHRFLEGPGSSEVQADNYEIFSAKNSQVVISENTRLLPGASIIMATLLDKPAGKVYTDETCPMPRCGSILTRAAPGGGRICEQCNVWFDHSKKKRSLEFLLSNLELEDDASSEDSFGSENLEGRPKKVSDSEESLDFFKNVKLAEEIPQDL
ncbi:hypothetical protein LAWI1_G007091 [Lachnellula willkommii]|uniref:Ubiquitin-like domain-containing protein n=1 Tax=Lachnellula willkommii TaxID=215461 RepID=A0A559M2F6_9HELO|nr:hypothetical protein LAWI1_G007091 [Lachnellula willkommii]